MQDQRICRECGASIPPKTARRGPRRSYCEDCRPAQEPRTRVDTPDAKSRITCKRCAQPLAGNQRMWCSSECREIAVGVRRAEPLPKRDCVVCGATFQPTLTTQTCCPPTDADRARLKGQARSRCAKALELANRRGVPPEPPRTLIQSYDCAQCGKTCMPGVDVVPHASRFCGVPCKKEWYREHVVGRKARRVRVETKARRAAEGKKGEGTFLDCTCRECGERFLSKRSPATYYCSRECLRRVLRRRRRAAGRQRIGLHAIAKRDGWRCGICHRKVSRTALVPHPRSPTLDHIVPIALGGKHTRENVQLAHFLCNSTKGAIGTGDQLLLVG